MLFAFFRAEMSPTCVKKYFKLCHIIIWLLRSMENLLTLASPLHRYWFRTECGAQDGHRAEPHQRHQVCGACLICY